MLHWLWRGGWCSACSVCGGRFSQYELGVCRWCGVCRWTAAGKRLRGQFALYHFCHVQWTCFPTWVAAHLC